MFKFYWYRNWRKRKQALVLLNEKIKENSKYAEQIIASAIEESIVVGRSLRFEINEQIARDVGYIMSERRLVSDMFVCGIERLKREGKLSDVRADWYYQQASLHLGLDTYYRPATGERLKQGIRDRLGPYWKPILFKPVPFPDRRWKLKEMPLGSGQPPWKE